MMEPVEQVLQIGHRQVELSHLDRVLFPDIGLTMGDLVVYYQRIAETMLPHLEQRPISLEQRPDPRLYQVPEHFPAWVKRQTIELRQGCSQEHLVCNDAATLVFLANQGTITPRVWQSRVDALEQPDRLVLDLAPPGNDFTPVRHAARLVAAAFEELGLVPYAMLTGSRGLHLVAPLRREPGFDQVRELAQGLARWLARQHPDQLSVASRRAERGDRLYLDTGRNGYGKTTVAPYAVRALPGAPVATPIDLDELSSATLSSRRYNLRNIFRRLAHKADPWLGMRRDAGSLQRARRRLEQIVGCQEGDS